MLLVIPLLNGFSTINGVYMKQSICIEQTLVERSGKQSKEILRNNRQSRATIYWQPSLAEFEQALFFSRKYNLELLLLITAAKTEVIQSFF